MAATVVLVVSFLSGVLVGRGVRAERAAEVQADALTESPAASPAKAAPETTSLGADPREAGPPPGVAEEPGTAAEAAPAAAIDDAPVAVKRSEMSAPAAPPPAKKAESERPAEPEPTPVAARPTAPVAPPTANRTGYTVQVAAVDRRAEADTMAKRLNGKGYDAYVEQQKGNGKFRIRVGSFRTRRDAQLVADRLKKEEKFKPWVTR